VAFPALALGDALPGGSRVKETAQGTMSERDRESYERAKALWHYQMVRLDHDDAEALRALAKRRKTTVAELTACSLHGDWRMATMAEPIRISR
jgi:hypothetical protein